MKYLFLTFCLVLCSCSFKEDALNGACSEPPKLSKEKLLFNALGGIDSIVVNLDSWRFYKNISNCEFIGAFDDPDYCDGNDANYCKKNYNWIVKVNCPWYNIIRTDDYKIVVSVSKNETGEERNQDIDIQAGNCYSGFSITQSAE